MNEHPIRISPLGKRLRVRWNGIIVADSKNALVLHEASYPGVRYIPRDDANFVHLERTEHTTRCPYKGQASYFSLVSQGKHAENGVWSYEKPFPAAHGIASLLAFNPSVVEFIEASCFAIRSG